jgi:anaerobic C4-dicarboxylate transporter
VLFALPFAYGAVRALIGVVLALTGEREDVLLSLVDTTLWVVRVIVYGLAAALLFTTPAHRTTWTILLALGVALTIFDSVRYGEVYMVLLPVYLTLVAAVQLVRAGASEARSADGTRDSASRS